MNTERDALDEPALLEAPALRDQVLERLRDEILAGDLVQGERLSATALAHRFGVSTMPVRDALRVLEQEGLVESAARRWTRVVELAPELVEQVVPLVAVLEEHAVRTAGDIDDAHLDELTRANRVFAKAIERRDARTAVEADTVFHEALVALARNESLDRALRDARSRVRLLRAHVVGTELPSNSIGDHDEIVTALRRRDRDRACEALRRNWQRGLDRYRANPVDR